VFKRGETPLSKLISPSLIKGRGTKGVGHHIFVQNLLEDILFRICYLRVIINPGYN
jgi:hypothetical protein